jgi:hypothetical protein
MKRVLFLALLITGVAYGQQVSPRASQTSWPNVTGAGTPTAPCTSANYGQPYQNTAVTPNTYYTCGTDGWAIRGGSGSPSFSAITAGTNTNALVMGTGGSLGTSGTGTINATTLLGNTWAAPGTIGATTPAPAFYTNVTDSALTSGNCIQAGPAGILTTPGGPCNSQLGVGTIVEYTTITLSIPARTTGTCNDTGAFTTPSLSGNSTVTGSLNALPASGLFLAEFNYASGHIGDITVCDMVTSTGTQSLTWNIMVVTPLAP